MLNPVVEQAEELYAPPRYRRKLTRVGIVLFLVGGMAFALCVLGKQRAGRHDLADAAPIAQEAAAQHLEAAANVAEKQMPGPQAELPPVRPAPSSASTRAPASPPSSAPAPPSAPKDRAQPRLDQPAALKVAKAEPESSSPTARRLTIPSPKDIDRAAGWVKQQYAAEYERKRPEDKDALRRKLQAAAKQQTDPSRRFVCLQEAMDLAMEIGHVYTPLQLIDDLAQGFDVDVLELETVAVEMASHSADELSSKGVAENALNLIDHALAEDNFDAALRLIQVAEYSSSRAGKTRKEALDPRLIGERGRIEKARQNYADFEQACELLLRRPDDAAASRTVGSHLCLVNCNWKEGVSLLAQGSDLRLASVAQEDLAGPTEATAQARVGDAWCRRVDEKDRLMKTALLSRGRHWYRLALAHPDAKAGEITRRLGPIEAFAWKLPPDLRMLAFPDLVREKKTPAAQLARGQLVQEPARRRRAENLQNQPAPGGRPFVNPYALVPPNAPVIVPPMAGRGGFGAYFRGGMYLRIMPPQ
jgi:hypothetical protein